MRLLFLTNFYPPESRGGYELWCQEVAEHLSRSRHEVVVLTSRSRTVADVPAPGIRIARELYLEMEIDSRQNVGVFFFDRARRARANLACADRWFNAFKPDVVVIWGMWNLDRSLAAFAEQRCGRRTVYYFGDYWPTLPSQWRAFWDAPARGRIARTGKWLLKGLAGRQLDRGVQPALSFPHGLFPSDFMRRSYEQAAIPVGRASVVLGGVVTEAYRREADRCVREKPQGEWKALVAGRLTPEKGIDTAVRAVAVLADGDRQRRWSLTIVGTGEEDYVSTLKEQAVRLGIADRVRFAGAVPPAEMPRALCEHDVFVFPSTWDEPFGRVLVEAMAARVPVVGTTVGGAGEILRDGETGLAFAPGDAAGLAAQLERLVASPELRERLVERGQATVVSDFDTSRMAAGIEVYLEEVTREEDNKR